MCSVCGEAISEQDKEELGTSLNRPFELFVLWHSRSLMPATVWAHVTAYAGGTCECFALHGNEMHWGTCLLVVLSLHSNEVWEHRCFYRRLWIIIPFFWEFVHDSLHSVHVKSLHKYGVILTNSMYLIWVFCNCALFAIVSN